METVRTLFYTISLVFLGIIGLLGLIRAFKGPRTADRIMGINILNTIALLSIAILAYLLKEAWLLDVCMIYGLISALSVVVLTTLHIASGKEKEEEHHD